MRIYRRDAFLALPPGVVYCQDEEYTFSGLRIKERTIHDDLGVAIDWFYREPQDIDSDDSDQRDRRLEEMRASSEVSYPLDTCLMRDGMFDPDALFLVYEPDDLRALSALLDTAPPLP
jgi:hypothetical protein